MPQSSLVVLAGTLASIAFLSPVAGQQKAALTKPDAETSESFTRISSIRELPSGKVLVADISDKVIQLVDLAGGTMTKVGREGNGPGEYAFPRSLVALPDGSTLVHDMLNRRFLTITPDGKTGAFVEMPRPPAGTERITGPLGGITNIGGVDDRGRIYFEGSPFSAGGGSADSVPILRWDRVKPSFDTVGFKKQPPGSASAVGGNGQFRMTIGGGKRFTPAELWSVAGDGTIARVFPEPYRVAWFSSRDQATMGAVVPYTPMKVTEEDKRLFIEAQKKQAPIRLTIGGPGGGGARPSAGGGGTNFTPPPPEFADTKPPFDGAGSALATPDGEIWVLRTRPASDKVPTYDVFDRAGTLVKKVSLNPESRVAGFGKGTVYVVRTDQDDLQYLQRYKRP